MLSVNSGRILQRINGRSGETTAVAINQRYYGGRTAANLTDVNTTIITHRPRKAGNWKLSDLQRDLLSGRTEFCSVAVIPPEANNPIGYPCICNPRIIHHHSVSSVTKKGCYIWGSVAVGAYVIGVRQSFIFYAIGHKYRVALLGRSTLHRRCKKNVQKHKKR